MRELSVLKEMFNILIGIHGHPFIKIELLRFVPFNVCEFH